MIRKVVFKIEDLECSSCVISLDGDVEDSGMVKSCRTSYAKSVTEVEFDPERISEEEIMGMIGQTGYKAVQVKSG